MGHKLSWYHRGLKREPEHIRCIICGKMSAYLGDIENRLVRVTGTFKIAGQYRQGNKVVGKEYAHYPDCGAQKATEWRIVI